MTIAKRGWKSYFFSTSQKGPTNKSFLFLNISYSYCNCALPYMPPTYPDKMRLLGPRSWEEIDFQQTNRLPTGFRPPSHSPPHIARNFFFSIFYTQLPRCARELDNMVYTRLFNHSTFNLESRVFHAFMFCIW